MVTVGGIRYWSKVIFLVIDAVFSLSFALLIVYASFIDWFGLDIKLLDDVSDVNCNSSTI